MGLSVTGFVKFPYDATIFRMVSSLHWRNRCVDMASSFSGTNSMDFFVADTVIDQGLQREISGGYLSSFVMILGWIDPLWSSPMQWDQADHLQTANRYLERWGWEPFHQGKDYSFRPKIMSGLLAIELGFSEGFSMLILSPFYV